MYLRRGGTQPSNGERWLLYVAFIACFLMYVTAINTDLGDRAAVSVPRSRHSAPGRTRRVLALLAVGVVSAAVFLWRIVPRTHERARCSPCCCSCGSQFAWFAAATGMPLFSRGAGPRVAADRGAVPDHRLPALRAVSRRHRLLRQARSGEAGGAPFSVVRYLAVLDRRRCVSVDRHYARVVAGVRSRLRHLVLADAVAHQHPSLRHGRSDLEAARWTPGEAAAVGREAGSRMLPPRTPPPRRRQRTAAAVSTADRPAVTAGCVGVAHTGLGRRGRRGAAAGRHRHLLPFRHLEGGAGIAHRRRARCRRSLQFGVGHQRPGLRGAGWSRVLEPQDRAGAAGGRALGTVAEAQSDRDVGVRTHRPRRSVSAHGTGRRRHGAPAKRRSSTARTSRRPTFSWPWPTSSRATRRRRRRCASAPVRSLPRAPPSGACSTSAIGVASVDRGPQRRQHVRTRLPAPARKSLAPKGRRYFWT